VLRSLEGLAPFLCDPKELHAFGLAPLLASLIGDVVLALSALEAHDWDLVLGDESLDSGIDTIADPTQ
jgi:hypothetical protein